ncbi:MAG: aroK [Chitinophagaceae bacterium]|nr:aroK [Chitinophagaceae bacterium]
MLIFLIGLPGSGKTTLGKQLAKQIHYVFSDLDEAIVKAHHSTIEEIFLNEGEATFRTYESQCLQAYSKHENIIVSTGGGAPCFHNNMKWMNETGVSIFLNPPLTELAKRLSVSDNSHRPMLKGKDENDLLSFLEAKFKERSLFYGQSKIIIDKINPSVSDLIEKIKPYI